MKQKILKWVYDESSNAYDLYFNPYNDSEPEPVATIAEDAGTWELVSSLTCSNCFLNAESLEDAKNETMNLVEEYYQDKIDYYEQLLEEFDDARKETENDG